VTTKTGFNNEQFEASAADANIPRLALRGITELQEFIEAHKAPPESVRHLADVFSRKLLLPPAAPASENAAIPSHVSTLSPENVPPVSVGTLPRRTHLQTIREGILNRLLPIGYQDEAGFHSGVNAKSIIPAQIPSPQTNVNNIPITCEQK
jgi:hypothetical protein